MQEALDQMHQVPPRDGEVAHGPDTRDRPGPGFEFKPADRKWMAAEGHGQQEGVGALEQRFDVTLVAALAQKEKQIQQNYRPVIGVHKWFARRPGALFRALLLSEFAEVETLKDCYFKTNDLSGRIVMDPFMGGGTPLFEANRVGINIIGCDVNPMAYWVVHQELGPLDRAKFRVMADVVIEDLQEAIGSLYETTCMHCGAAEAVVKYFLWVKQQRCASCQADFDLSPGPLVARNERHTHCVFLCSCCQGLTEEEHMPSNGFSCRRCGAHNTLQGSARRSCYTCPHCGHQGKYPGELCEDGPPRHRLFAIEYFCHRCKEAHKGRFFKTPDQDDLARMEEARRRLEAEVRDLIIPEDPIPNGAETKRLHRWGYSYFRDLFNERQLLGLGLLTRQIAEISDRSIRQALATVFSDALRYQNMLCRYDTMALKCQDIFSVHGFPVSLIQCENNLLGIPGVGSGGFRHFVEKYDRAKAYCERPFETIVSPSGRKRLLPVPGERIMATFVDRVPRVEEERAAWLMASSAEDLALPPEALDGVFTDPPYYDNVQYAELMDFCYAWLRKMLVDDVPEFQPPNTRTDRELTGNKTLGRGLEYFTEGLSRVFSAVAKALKPGAPFVFTYHHNDIEAYAPVCVALLDAALLCTAVLPAPAEMGASLHINGTDSSTVDSVVVCRSLQSRLPDKLERPNSLENVLLRDGRELTAAGLRVTRGDLTCLALGLVMAGANRRLLSFWDAKLNTDEKLSWVLSFLKTSSREIGIEAIIERVYEQIVDSNGLPVRQRHLFEREAEVL